MAKAAKTVKKTLSPLERVIRGHEVRLRGLQRQLEEIQVKHRDRVADLMNKIHARNMVLQKLKA